jgi:hypothetical protein
MVGAAVVMAVAAVLVALQDKSSVVFSVATSHTTSSKVLMAMPAVMVALPASKVLMVSLVALWAWHQAS